MTRLLAVDIGNTEVVCGLYEEGTRGATHRIKTSQSDLTTALAPFLESAHGGGAAIASVVPAATQRWRDVLSSDFGFDVRVLDALAIPDLAVSLEEPEAVGMDRLVNAWNARRRWGAPIVVVDMGTATTFDVVDHDGVYRGGAIAPGIGLSFEILAQGTALLPKVENAPLERAIGRNTVEAIRSGVILGQAEMIRGMARRFAGEFGNAPIIATGGATAILVPLLEGLFTDVDPFLTLDGIAAIANPGEWKDGK